MSIPLDLTKAVAAIADSSAVVERLHLTCCEPGRSPRMERLTATLSAVGGAITRAGEDESARAEAATLIEEAGAQVGWLQVACCSEKRLPMYTQVLANLTTAHMVLEQHGH